MEKRVSRRAVLRRALQLPLAGGLLLTLGACSDDKGKAQSSGLVCADPSDMTSAEASVRRSLAYTELSSEAGKECSGCEFFSAGDNGCGSCVMFDGKPVNARGHCNSWSADS